MALFRSLSRRYSCLGDTARRRVQFVSFFIPLCLMALLIYVQFLLGDYYLIYTDYGSDSFGQSVPFFLNAVDRFSSLNFSAWNPSQFLGTEVVQLFNPEYIVSWFGRDIFPYAMCWAQIAKVVIAGVFFYLFLGYFRVSYGARCISSLGIAFCGRMIALSCWTAYTAEVSLLAVLLWSIVRVLEDKNKFIAFPISFALMAMLLSVYGFVLYTLVTIMFTLFYLGFCGLSDSYRSMRSLLLRLFLLYISGIMLAAPAIFPQIKSYMESARVSQESGGGLLAQSGVSLASLSTLSEEFVGLFSGSLFGFMGESTSPSGFLGTAYYSSGVCTILALPFAFKNRTRRERIWICVLLVFAGVYCFSDSFRYLLNGGAVASTDFRMSSVWVIFVFALIGSLGLNSIFSCESSKKILLWSLLLVVALFCACWQLGFNVRKLRVVGTALLLVAFAVCLTKCRRYRLCLYFLPLLCVFEVFFSGYRLANDVPAASAELYWSSFNTDLEEAVDSYTTDQPARIGFQSQMLTCSMANDFMGTESYIGGVGTSGKVTQFLSTVGNDYIEQRGYSRYAYGFSDISLNAMLSVGYQVYSGPETKYIAPLGYSKIDCDGYYQIYDNQYDVSFLSFFGEDEVVSEDMYLSVPRSERSALLLHALVLSENEDSEGSTSLVSSNTTALAHGKQIGQSEVEVTGTDSSSFALLQTDSEYITLEFDFSATASESGCVTVEARFYTDETGDEGAVLPLYLAAGNETIRIPVLNGGYSRVSVSITGMNACDDAVIDN